MIVIVLQARMSSSRLPGKVLKPLHGRPMLAQQIERVRRASRTDRLIVATTLRPEDDAIADLCQELGVNFSRGSRDDVLDRFYQAVKDLNPTHVVRITGDCPLIDPANLDEVVDLHLLEGNDHTHNSSTRTYPDGLDVEVMTFASLEAAWREARLPSEREHVTPFIYKQPERFKLGEWRSPVNHGSLRLTVDEPDDLELVTRIFEALYPENPTFSLQDIVDFLEANPELKELNQAITPNAGYLKSLEQDRAASRATLDNGGPQPPRSSRYARSEAWLERAERSIPLGSQTFSKSKTQYPHGVSPYFIQRGLGSRVWDIDGNAYLDFINGLASVTLGYLDPDVTAAVQAQLQEGTIFSLAHPIEAETAEQIVEMVPCAEMVRFGKNGSDATSGAVRVARAYTGRDHVAVCGYHGWQDWYIGSTARHKGVPDAVRRLTHAFPYNDVASLEAILIEHRGNVAAVVLEPLGFTPPQDDFLERVQALAHHHGALLIFDETVSGFRVNQGGAQAHFGVTPDLATLG